MQEIVLKIRYSERELSKALKKLSLESDVLADLESSYKLYNVLVEIRLITSKTKCGIWYSKLSIQVASRAAERLKTWDLRK